LLIGLPKEIKDNEFRVALTPGAVKALTAQGHRVRVEAGAGLGSAIADDEYSRNGAQIVDSAKEAWEADIVVKVKEPIIAEYEYVRSDLMLFTYLHLAANEPLIQILLKQKTTAIAYETVQTQNGHLPLLIPMSEVAGRMATQVGAYMLQKNQGGRGVLMGGVPGVAPANVVVLGGGTVGANATRVAVGMGAQVTVLDVNHDRLAFFDDLYKGHVHTRKSNFHAIESVINDADLVIGAVLLPGGKTPWLIDRNMLGDMKSGAVVVDVAVDQGGCVETSRPTTHSQPTFVVEGIVHYCVANMPGAVPRTSTFALVNETLEYVLMLANQGDNALRQNPALQAGLNTYAGHVTHAGVAAAFDLNFVPPSKTLGS
jgi:alanine dehydrogenase